ncbi:prepilin peptidase [Amycolatopsis magusensis]|uniref:prepilin peptidase n=1 Tax=Amycolatopsis magusensis TaxID=882444 RepID=UPI0037BBB1DD
MALVVLPALVRLVRSTAETQIRRQHLVALALAAVGTGALAATWPWATTAAGALLVLLAVPAAVVDGLEHRIPDRLSLPLLGGTAVALATAALLDTRPGQLGPTLAAGAAWGGLFLLSYLLSGHPGPGDVKLAPSLGMLLGWFGWNWLLAGVVLTYVLALAIGVTGVALGRLRWRDGLPMAPPMLASTVLVTTAASLNLT